MLVLIHLNCHKDKYTCKNRWKHTLALVLRQQASFSFFPTHSLTHTGRWCTSTQHYRNLSWGAAATKEAVSYLMSKHRDLAFCFYPFIQAWLNAQLQT